jgi:predicted hotdog family 3-hydroxylacyl-ACP dehydratase
MAERIDIAALVPHQGAMCLWREVVSHDASNIMLRTDSHRDPGNPLRRDGRLRALHLCEYGAQAMAVHGGLLGRDSGAPVRKGMLVALRGVELLVARIDDLPGELTGEAVLLAAGADSQQYAFRILHAGTLLAEGRAAVMLQAPLPPGEGLG